jgi:hypothetical protein
VRSAQCAWPLRRPQPVLKLRLEYVVLGCSTERRARRANPDAPSARQSGCRPTRRAGSPTRATTTWISRPSSSSTARSARRAGVGQGLRPRLKTAGRERRARLRVRCLRERRSLHDYQPPATILQPFYGHGTSLSCRRDAPGRCRRFGRSRRGRDPGARPERSGFRSGHKPRLLALRASTSYAEAAGGRCRSRARWSYPSTRSASHESRELLQRLGSPNPSAARPAQVEHVPTCFFELGVVKRSRLVQRSAVPEVPRVERCPRTVSPSTLTGIVLIRWGRRSLERPCAESGFP